MVLDGGRLVVWNLGQAQGKLGVVAGGVPGSRQVATNAPLSGGGDLSADRTLGIAKGTALADGYLSATDFAVFAAKENALTFGGPLARAGDAVSLPKATALVDGYLSAADFATLSAKVSGTRQINTTAPLTGGGDLSADRTFALDFTGAWTWTANGIAAAPADRVILSNTAAAVSGTQQYSPALRFTGQGFKTDATTGSKATDWRVYNQPAQAAGNPTSNLLFQFSVDGGAFATKMTLSSTGTSLTLSGGLVAGGDVTSGGLLQAAATDIIRWLGRGRMASPSDGVIGLYNNAQNDFTRLQFGGTSSSFPALKRNAAALNAVLADDSAACAFTALSFQSGNPASGTAKPWKFGSVITTASVLDTSRYLEADVNGVAVKIALMT